MAKEITVIILHYNRPNNIKKIIDGIRKQTVKSNIIIYDNSGNYPIGSGEDIYLKSRKNTYCQGRYDLINTVDTEYIFNTDDDLAIIDNTLFAQFLEFSKKYPTAVIGWNGRKFHKNINWDKAYSFPDIGFGGGFIDSDESESINLDVINFGVSFYPTNILKGKNLNPYMGKFAVSEVEFKHGDDIWISAQLEEKRVMPFILKDKFEWLNEGNFALSKQPPHMNMRDNLCKRFFKDKYD